jgi:penicillin amidase
MRKWVIVVGAAALLLAGLQAPGAPAAAAQRLRVPGLQHAAHLTQDTHGITHVEAASLHDALLLQGWVQARDREFQMDVNRRLPSGTLAELLGKGALQSDVQLRTIGLRRAAQRSWDAAAPELRNAVQAFTAGVNAYAGSHALAPEYGALGVTSFAPWTPVDSIVVGKLIAFGLSFDLDIDRTVRLQTYVAALGPVKGAALLSQDVGRVEPFSHASTVPDATHLARAAAALARGSAVRDHLNAAAALGRAYLAKVREIPVLQRARTRDGAQGSNEWAVSGARTVTGLPIMANDPHLALSMPSTFYPIGLRAHGLNVEGEGFAGAPGVVLGHNDFVEWGATTNPMDVTDTYLEQVQPDASSPSGLSTTYRGAKEHVLAIPETFRYNTLAGGVATATAADGVPPVTLVVPRRNNGPILQLGGTPGSALPAGQALSVQYTGFSATQELLTFLMWDRARSLREFRAGLDYFDVGSQNWAYADRRGNIAYFTSAEMPVREDLQAGTVTGLPPWFIRSGTGGNEWAPVTHRQPHQATPYEIYRQDEMPQVVNPPAGWFVNANNDPAGTNLDNDPLNQLRAGGGIYYLNAGYDGFRAGRITEMLRARLAQGKVSVADMKAMQADTVLLDAEYFVPWIRQAFAAATAPGARAAGGPGCRPAGGAGGAAAGGMGLQHADRRCPGVRRRRRERRARRAVGDRAGKQRRRHALRGVAVEAPCERRRRAPRAAAQAGRRRGAVGDQAPARQLGREPRGRRLGHRLLRRTRREQPDGGA